MGVKELSCPQCGSPIELGGIRKSDRSAECGSCGSVVDIRSDLAVARRKKLVIRKSKFRLGPLSISLWLLTVFWFAGSVAFSPLKWLEEKQLVLVFLFVLYLTVGLIGLMTAAWVTMNSRRRP